MTEEALKLLIETFCPISFITHQSASFQKYLLFIFES